VWVIVVRVVSAIANVSPDFYKVSLAITNYSGLVFPLAAFIIIGSSSRLLVSRARVSISATDTLSIILLFAVGGITYCFLLFRRFASSSLASSDNIFQLPFWLVILTIIVPYLYTWFVGLLAAWEINTYAKSLNGVLYRQPFRLLVGGLMVVIFSIIAFQYVSSLVFSSTSSWLGNGLVATQLLIIMRGIGFLCIGIGVARLKRIEEI
jgi:hypothetical protein